MIFHFYVKLIHTFYFFPSSSFFPSSLFLLVATSKENTKSIETSPGQSGRFYKDSHRWRSSRGIYKNSLFFFSLSPTLTLQEFNYFSRSASSELTHENSFYSRISWSWRHFFFFFNLLMLRSPWGIVLMESFFFSLSIIIL